MASHRYWRIQAKAIQSGTNFALAEIQMRIVAGGADQTAPGGAVLSSSDFAGLPKANAVDDNPATHWATLTNQQINGWIGYDFGSAIEVVEVVLTARNDTYFGQAASIFHVAGSDDGVTWIDYKRHTAATWTTGSTQTFAVPLTVNMGAARVHGMSLEVFHSNPGKLRFSGMALEILRTIADMPEGRRRQQHTG